MVEEEISKEFLPALWGQESPTRVLTRMVVKKGGMGIPNPMVEVESNFRNSKAATAHLSQTIQKNTTLSMVTHIADLQESRVATARARDDLSKETWKGLESTMPKEKLRAAKREMETGAWLTVLPQSINGTDLSCVEFRDHLALRYGMTPVQLPKTCDGCGGKMDVNHILGCKKGGLIHQRHDELHDELGYLGSHAMHPGEVREEPLIYAGAANHQSGAVLVDNTARGDLMIRGMWNHMTECIVDVRIMNLDSHSYLKRDSVKVLASQVKEKHTKYLAACRNQRKDFSAFVYQLMG